jgi:hypothetical protein
MQPLHYYRPSAVSSQDIKDIERKYREMEISQRAEIFKRNLLIYGPEGVLQKKKRESCSMIGRGKL